MTNEDLKTLSKALERLCIVHNREYSIELLEAFFEAFIEYDIETVVLAMKAAEKAFDRFPPIKWVLELIEGRSDDKAIIAYQQAYGAVARYGKYHSVLFGDPAITATIKNLGGWLKFCDLEFNEWTRKEFERIYKSFSNVPCDHETLHGLLAIDNNSKGFAYSDVKSIGQVNKTQKIGISGREGHMSKSALEFMGVRK